MVKLEQITQMTIWNLKKFGNQMGGIQIPTVFLFVLAMKKEYNSNEN